MEIKTFRAKSMPQALALVRDELGPEAMVLHTRELNAGLLARMFRGREYEIAASVSASTAATEHSDGEYRDSHFEVNFPIPSPSRGGLGRGAALQQDVATDFDTHDEVTFDFTPKSRLPIPQRESRVPQPITPAHSPALEDFTALVEKLRTRTTSPTQTLPPALFDVFTDMIEADVDEQLARDLIDRLRHESHLDLANPLAARARLAQMIEQELRVTGPITMAPGAGRVVALVGPTGVGKTTTIAKLAANYRLRENRRVGLITVDTYRIAAVEQLRTYADIIDLPMEVVSTPKQMREAARRLSNLDLVLIDTAGRSPRDEVKLQELKAMLGEAQADEVHLVLSSVASAASLASTAEKFAPVGTTALILTKLDESSGLGNLLPLLRASKLPLSYLTNGQNVPEDIEPAERRRLARAVLGMDTASLVA
jgi:flagellar biosynthesis protein FlhF